MDHWVPTAQSADSWRRGAPSFCLSALWMDKGIRRRQPRGPWATARTRWALKEGMWLDMSAPPRYLGATCSSAALCHAGWAPARQPGLFVPFIFWSLHSEGLPQRTLGTHARRLCSGVRNPGFPFHFSTYSFVVSGRTPGSICTMQVNGAPHLHHCLLKRIKAHLEEMSW